MATKKTTSKSKSKVSTKKRKVTKIDKDVRYHCTKCGTANKTKFYQSISDTHEFSKTYTICKDCMNEKFQEYLTIYEDGKYAFYLLCRKFDIYYTESALNGAIKNLKFNDRGVLGNYMKQLNLGITNGYGKTFDEADSNGEVDKFKVTMVVEDEETQKELEELRKFKAEQSDKSDKMTVLTDTKRKEVMDVETENSKIYVVKVLGYDPFEDEREEDKPLMYNMLNDYLDDDTRQDNFKIPICIQIVKNFNQVSRIDEVIANMNPATDYVEMKKIADVKKDIIKSTLEMAKDNGISANHNNNRSKGANTLTGILKKLKEMNLREAEVNLFNIETAMGMKQVADISNKSILEQLMFDENEYVDMIAEQKEMLHERKAKLDELEEENRLLRIKIKELEEK